MSFASFKASAIYHACAFCLPDCAATVTITRNNTRQGYAPRSTLKPAGYLFLGG